MVEVEIDGVGVVELDDSFTKLSPQDQQKTVNEISARHNRRRSTDIQKASAAAKGFNVGALSDVVGFPVDLINAGLSRIGLGSEVPFGGSESIRRGLTAGGMGYMDEQDLPQDQRALARGGRTAGQIVGSAAPVFGAARTLSPAQALMQSAPKQSSYAGSNVIKKLMDTEDARAIKQIGSEMVKSTARNPGQMAVIEGGSALGAGQARMIAENVAPGDELTGTLAELGGGLLSPIALARKPLERGKQFADAFSESGRERAASNKVMEILREQNPGISDDELLSLARQLRESDSVGRTAQVTENEAARRTFTAIDNKLIADAGDEAKTAIQNQNKNTIAAFNRKIKKMQNSGNPEMVKEAARLRLDTFTKSLNKRVENAETRMGEAIAKVLNKNSDDAVLASKEARKIIDTELKKARQTETQLWSEVDKSVTIPNLGISTIKKTDKIKAEMLPEEKLPAPIEAFVNRLRRNEEVGKDAVPYFQRQSDLNPSPKLIEKPTPIPARELFTARSRALEMAREATAQSKFGKARRMNEIADAMLDDLMTVSDETATVARDFSRNLNERFNTKLIRGIRNQDPELALEQGIGSLTAQGDTSRALNIKAMKQATESDEASMALAKAQKSFVQKSAARVVNSQTGEIDPRKLSELIQNNPQTLREVGLLDDMNDMNQRVKLVRTLQKTASDGRAFATQRSLASQLIDEGSKRGGLTNVIDNAFKSKFQRAAFNDLSKLVTRTKNPEALEGLRHAIFDNLLEKATIKGGNLDGLISGKKLNELLNTKVGDNTLQQNLLASKLLTPKQLTEVARVARKASIFENAATDPAKLNTIISTGDGLLNLLARVIGSKVGANSALGQVMGGSTLIAQSAFSKYAQKMLEIVPATKVQGVLTKAMEDPKFMAMLLEMSPKSPKQTQRRINAYLLQAGLVED